MKINVSLIEEDSDIALINRQIEIPDDGFINEHVRRYIDESDYEIIRIQHTKKTCLVYVSSRNRLF